MLKLYEGVIDDDERPSTSHPSTCKHAPTHDNDDDDDERPDEVPNYPEDLGDLSDGDIAEIFDNGNDDNDDDDDDDDDYDQRNQGNAYNPPRHMRNLDNALIDQPSRVLLHENLTLPMNAGIHKRMVFYTKKECVEAIKTWHINQSRHYRLINLIHPVTATLAYLLVCRKIIAGLTLIWFETSPTPIQRQVFSERLFWAFKPCIQGFAHCKPIVQVDRTWLYGKYKGTLLLAVAQDGNAHIFPVAFAIVEGETKDA
ncbi:hypothetical protein L195_g015518 [Trifolium pratense]|uniref:MULE transposase domain-containing protein n=1 Tax=Trifolium pratense TaxID=57577 RepID=A0A2K3MNJ6_TRIPR|nr:hypothetical protein L195_g015518 [Trifolium pratense]